jgi:hypothetical protein
LSRSIHFQLSIQRQWVLHIIIHKEQQHSKTTATTTAAATTATAELVYSWFKRQTSEIFVPLYSLSTWYIRDSKDKQVRFLSRSIHFQLSIQRQWVLHIIIHKEQQHSKTTATTTAAATTATCVMARTKQTARRSTGGKAPRKHLLPKQLARWPLPLKVLKSRTVIVPVPSLFVRSPFSSIRLTGNLFTNLL